MEDPVDEVKRLRRCINELIGIFTLPATGSDGELRSMLDTMLDALIGMLDLDLAYVGVEPASDGAPLQLARTASETATACLPQEIYETLTRDFSDEPAGYPRVIRTRVHGEDITIASYPLPLQGGTAVLCAGSRRTNFPRENERLLLGVAANQASLGIQEARLLCKQKRIVGELNRCVAERGAELECANEELRRQIGERRLVEEHLRQSIEDRTWTQTLLAGEKRLLEMIASGIRLPDVLAALCTFVESAAPECYCGVYPIDWTGPTFQYGVAPSLPASYTNSIEGLPVRCDIAPCGIAAYLKTQVIAEDIESDPRWRATPYREHVLAHGLRSVWSTPIYSREGAVMGTFCVYQRDPASPSPHQQELIAQVTHIASIAIERAESEAALKRSEAFLAEAQRLSRTGSFSWRVATDEITWSEQLYRIFEFEQSAPVTFALIRSRVHPDDFPLLNDMIARAGAAATDFEYEHRLLMPDQSVRYVHLTAHGTVGKDGALEYIGAAQDVTRHRLAEEAFASARSDLARVARITTLGALTASIAHEVNQPLSGIITNASTCRRMLAADPPNVEGARETVRRMIRDGNRASDVITRLRALFANKGLTIETVDLTELAREVIVLFATELQNNGIILRSDLADNLPGVIGDRVQLQQVILNLLRNAAEATVEGNDRPREVTIRTESNDADRVLLSVTDAGVGLDPRAMDRLFQVFYTTKTNGMGIGLAISRSIIESHKGHLWATPNDGPGATFSFSIPCSGAGVDGTLERRTIGSIVEVAAASSPLAIHH